MSYNMLHKPCILGIFGAILGMQGYQKLGELPGYYQQLCDLKVGIAPLRDEKGNFQKTTIVYTNTVGYANKDGNFIAYENTLIKPSYRVFVALSESHDLYRYLKNGEAEYIPYLGKNEFPVWWENFQEYELKPFGFDQNFEVKTLFVKSEEDRARGKEVKSGLFDLLSDPTAFTTSFFYFERLPIGFQEFDTQRGRLKIKEYQYAMAPFVYSNAKFSADYRLENLYQLEGNQMVQLN